MRLQINFLKNWKRRIVKSVIFISLIIFFVQSVSAGAIANYNWNGTHLIVKVTSPQGIGSAQIKLNVSSDLALGSASLTGFMTGAMHLQSGIENRWFQLSANGNSSGALAVPITCSYATGSYEADLIGINLKNVTGDSIPIDTTIPMYQTINCGEQNDPCDLNNDGIITKDFTDLMSAYKCFLGINQDCDKINYQDWRNMKQEYECFVNKR